MTTELSDLAMTARAWPFEEARSLCSYLHNHLPVKGYILFETGYGPSGLPHIGTFCEVARTAMIRQALSILQPDWKSQLVVFSDDLDGLREIPDNIPRQDMLARHHHVALTKVPDPFGCHDSFGDHNNSCLRSFLDHFGFDYRFESATDRYYSGYFDKILCKILEKVDDICALILPTLGEERQKNYSPFLPIWPETGEVLQAAVLAHDPQSGTIIYQDPHGHHIETPVTGGCCKLQWKVDWAARWVALDVDYEMFGKDLADSNRISGRIARMLGGKRPAGLTYEMFLDSDGHKISKSKGNGLSIETWLNHAPPESLSLYMYHAPRKARRLHLDIIPLAVDDYIKYCSLYEDQTPAEQLESPIWHICNDQPTQLNIPSGINFTMLLNLASACNAEDEDMLWGFIRRYQPGASPEAMPSLDYLTRYAVRYYHEVVKPKKQYRSLRNNKERLAIEDLANHLRALPENADSETIQNIVYKVGKSYDFLSLKEWFSILYEALLGQKNGPRWGSFITIYGQHATQKLIESALARSD